MADRKNGRYQVGRVGVDAGMVMVGDPCYLDNFGKGSTDGFNYVEAEITAQKKAKKYDFSYSGACAATLGDDSAGELGFASAVAVSSGYGDGVYPVFATYNNDGRIVKLEVIFEGEDEDYESENDDDDEEDEDETDSEDDDEDEDSDEEEKE